jgi:hypothetical protein
LAIRGLERKWQSTITPAMAFFKLTRSEAEKEQARMLKELARVAKAARQHAAKERKQQHKQAKQQQKQAKHLEKHLARKAEKERARRQRRQERQAASATVVAPPFSKSSGCFVCGKKFGKAPHQRRHHCRQCRKSCCLQCTSRTRRAVPRYGLSKPQKVCVVCETLVFNAEQAETPQPREPAEAVAALAASGRARRPHSAPLPRTEGVTVTLPSSVRRGRTRSSKSKGPSFWTLPIRPLLKRKKSAEQLRNRKMDEDLQIQKRLLFRGRAIELQPQAA